MNFLEERIVKDGIITEGNVLKVDSFLNHQMDIELFDQIGAEFELLAATFGFSSELTGGFPGWKYDPNSKLRATGMALFEKMFGRKMEIQATHGGLECGEFIGKIPDMDIMTVAPTCVGAHTTEEAMNIESFGKVMDYLVALLYALCNE